MDISRTSTYSIPRTSSSTTNGISPRKSKVTESVQQRRRDIEKSEKAAYWAILNAILATILYYDLCYIQIFINIGNFFIYFEWFICAIFTTNAFYDIIIHLWAYTFMQPIILNNTERRLLGIKEDEFGFKIQDNINDDHEQSSNQHSTNHLGQSYQQPQPYREAALSGSSGSILHLYDEGERIVTQQRTNLSSQDNSINNSRRSRITDKETLAEYLKEVQEKESFVGH